MPDRIFDIEAVALTDHGTLTGSIEFWPTRPKSAVSILIGGRDLHMAPANTPTRGRGKLDANPFHLILLAENNNCYQNLMKLITAPRTSRGFYYKPRIDREFIGRPQRRADRAGCAGGELGNVFARNGAVDEAESSAVSRHLMPTIIS